MVEGRFSRYAQSDEETKNKLFFDLLTSYTLLKSENYVLMQKITEYQDRELARDVQAFMMNENVQRL